MNLKDFWDRYDTGERNFEGENLSGAVFEHCDFHEIDLSFANLEDTDFSKCTFRNSKLNGINFCRATFFESQFIDTQIQGANFSQVSAVDLTLTRCDFKAANLSDSEFGDVYFIETNLSQSQWQGASWCGGATSSNLMGAKLDGLEATFVELIDTIIPNGSLTSRTWEEQLIQTRLLMQIHTQLTSSDQVEVSHSQSVEKYATLTKLLNAKRWEDADQETASLLCRLTGVEFPDIIEGKEVANIPCQDLLTIDQLWVEQSWGRFGFSVQHQIWRSIFSDYTMEVEKYRRFMLTVGWLIDGNGEYVCPEYDFPAEDYATQDSIQVIPSGCFPMVELWAAYYGAFVFDPGFESIYVRLSYCESTTE
jgi:uncharacterized protein YjbI with pentapeptide repeats